MKSLFLLTVSVVLALSGYCTTNPDSASFYLKKAVELSQNRKVWEAEKSFQKAVDFNPADVDIRVAYGDYLSEQHKYNPAILQYAKVLEGNMSNQVALQKMAEINFMLHRWNDVIVYGTQLGNSSIKGVKYMMGKSYYENENYGQAQKFLVAAVAENAKDGNAVSLLGKVYIEMSNYKQAIILYNQTLELDPNNNQVIYELGLLYYTLNDEKNAVKYFEEAAAKGYKVDLDFLENLGMASLGFDLKKGVETLQKVLEMKPNNVEIMFQIGQAYYKNEKFDDAASTYFQVFTADPTNARALYMTGVAYQKKGDKSKGIAYCEKAIQMDPNLAMLKTQKMSF